MDGMGHWTNEPTRFPLGDSIKHLPPIVQGKIPHRQFQW